MLTQSVLVTMRIVLYPDAFQPAFFENTILNRILGVETTNSLQEIAHMFPYTQDTILLQDESKSPSLIKTLLISKKAIVPHGSHDG